MWFTVLTNAIIYANLQKINRILFSWVKVHMLGQLSCFVITNRLVCTLKGANRFNIHSSRIYLCLLLMLLKYLSFLINMESKNRDSWIKNRKVNWNWKSRKDIRDRSKETEWSKRERSWYNLVSNIVSFKSRKIRIKKDKNKGN